MDNSLIVTMNGKSDDVMNLADGTAYQDDNGRYFEPIAAFPQDNAPQPPAGSRWAIRYDNGHKSLCLVSSGTVNTVAVISGSNPV